MVGGRQGQGGVLGLHTDELDRHRVPALVDELEVGVLAINAQPTPDDGAGVHIHRRTPDVRAFAVGLHVHLLDKGHKADQTRGVGHDQLGGAAQEIAVPDPVQRQLDRQVLGQWCLTEVFVHGARTGQEIPEGRAADTDGQGQPEGGPDRITSAHPIPEQKGALGGIPLTRRLGRGGGDGHQVLADVLGRNALVQQPALAAGGVGHGFLGGESLGRHHDQGSACVDPSQHAVKRPGVRVGDVVHPGAGVGQVGQGIGGHSRAQIRATDADVDDIGEGLVRAAATGTAADLVGKPAHAAKFSRHVGTDGGTPGALPPAQGHMQDGPVFGQVDVLATEHGVALLPELRLCGQCLQRLFNGRCEALSRCIQGDAGGGQGQSLDAPGIAVEQVAQVRVGTGVLGQGLPGGQFGGGSVQGRHVDRIWRGAGAGGHRWHPPAPAARIRTAGKGRPSGSGRQCGGLAGQSGDAVPVASGQGVGRRQPAATGHGHVG